MDLTSCKELLQGLPDKRKPSLKDYVAEHISDLNAARERGYNYLELTQKLNEQGVAIACSTLKKYVQQTNRTNKQPASNRLSVLPLPSPFSSKEQH